VMGSRISLRAFAMSTSGLAVIGSTSTDGASRALAALAPNLEVMGMGAQEVDLWPHWCYMSAG
jgi:hypothetical protein